MDEQKQDKITFLETHKTFLWVFLFLLLGLLIRIYKLGDHNLWYDEFCSLRATREFNFGDRGNPPFYYVLLSFWIRSFGPILAKYSVSGEFILRSLSMIFGVISIPLIYKLGKLFFDNHVGLVSAFILSISPIHIWYSQEARGYSFSTFLVMLIVYFFIMALKKRALYLWIGFVLTSIVALFTNYFSLFIIISVAILFFLKSYRSSLKHYLISLCFILIFFLPHLPLILQQIGKIKYAFWIPKPNLNSIATTFKNFNVGYNATPVIYFIAFIIFSLLFILGIQYWWKEKRKELLSLILFLLIPLILVYLISQIIPIYLDRQMMLFSSFYYIVISAGLAKIKIRIIKIMACLLMLILISLCLYNYFTYQMPLPQFYHIGVHVKKPVKSAADYINNGFKKDDLIAFSDASIIQIFFYLSNIPSKQIAHFFIESKFRNERYWYYGLKEYQRLRLQRAIDSNIINLEGELDIPGIKNLKDIDFKRVWLISSSWARDGKLEPHVKSVREFMQNNYALIETKEFDGIFVDLYCPRMD